jgi:hypothetical protein
MLSCLAIATVLVMLFARAQSLAADKDYLQRGEKELTADYQIKYDRAVRGFLSRGWRKDVVVRILDLPPFQPEWVAGIARTVDGYHAFYVTTPKQIWGALEAERSGDPKKKRVDYHNIRPTLQERAIPAPLAARIAALWRRVLADPKNYGKDPAIFLDTDQFVFHLSFFPGEHLTAHTTGLGRQGGVLWRLSAAIMGYLNGIPEREFVRDIAKAERKLGI